MDGSAFQDLWKGLAFLAIVIGAGCCGGGYLLARCPVHVHVEVSR